MDPRRLLRAGAASALILAAGCRPAPPPTLIRQVVPLPAPVAPATTPAPVPPLDPPAPPLATEGLPPLSDAGVLALRILESTERFTNDAIYEGGETPLEVDAMRTLFREKEPDAAFKSLLERGTLAGRLFALCGLWYTDPAAFRTAADRLREDEGDGTVNTMFGCLGGEVGVSDLLRHGGKDPAVRLRDRKQTIRSWCEEAKTQDVACDIEGGGYPSLFRLGSGW